MLKTAVLCFPKIDGWEAPQYLTGLYKIKSFCHNKYNIIIIDERLENAEHQIEELLNRTELICIGISVMTGIQIEAAIRISKLFHDRATIVWGGIHPTILPVQTIQERYVDYIIRGDGEESFLNLLEYLDHEDVKKELFLSKENENINLINCLDNLNASYIDFESEKIRDEYFVKRDGFKRAFSIETSRGCTHNCAFCHNTIIGHHYRTMSTDNVIKNIDQLFRIHNIDGIIFQEDNFFLNFKRAIDIISKIKHYPIGWKANSRLDYFSRNLEKPKIMDLIENSDCHVLQFGIESGSNRILNLINKGLYVDQIIDINKRLSSYNIAIRYNFIVGFPTETLAEIKSTLSLMELLQDQNPNVEVPFLNIYTPYPGTPMYELAIHNGFHPPSNLEEWSQNSWNNVGTFIMDEDVKDFLIEISQRNLKKSKYLR